MRQILITFPMIALLSGCAGNSNQGSNTEQNIEATAPENTEQNIETSSPENTEVAVSKKDALTNWNKPLYELDSKNDTVTKWVYNEKGLLIKKICYRDNKPYTTIDYKYEGKKCIYPKEGEFTFDPRDIYHATWSEQTSMVEDEYEDASFSKLVSVNNYTVQYDENGLLSKIYDLEYSFKKETDGTTSLDITYSFHDQVKLDETGRVTYRDNTANYPSMTRDYYQYDGNVITHTSEFEDAYRGEDGMIEGGDEPEKIITKIYCTED